jgi:hypothetical protein
VRGLSIGRCREADGTPSTAHAEGNGEHRSACASRAPPNTADGADRPVSPDHRHDPLKSLDNDHRGQSVVQMDNAWSIKLDHLNTIQACQKSAATKCSFKAAATWTHGIGLVQYLVGAHPAWAVLNLHSTETSLHKRGLMEGEGGVVTLGITKWCNSKPRALKCSLLC